MCVSRGNVTHAFTHSFSPALEENAALLASVRWRRRQRTSHWRQSPFLYIGFNENKAHLSKIHVHLARTIGADGRKEVLRLEAMRDILELFAVARKENGASSRAIPYSNDVALNIGWSIGCTSKGLVKSPGAMRSVCNRSLVIAW